MLEISRSEIQTENLAERFSDQLKAGDFIALYGSLGSGKTVFVRGLCRGLGCSIDVHSPTFNIINFYPGIIEVAHVDLYRIEKGIEELGWYELLDSDKVVIVEWAEKAKNDLPLKRFDIFFSIVDNNTREIRIEKINGAGS
jgi:tRNA threonylcarbamoyladenosine biosynthesis protein TsaE